MDPQESGSGSESESEGSQQFLATDFAEFLLATDALLEPDDPHSNEESVKFIQEMLSEECQNDPEKFAEFASTRAFPSQWSWWLDITRPHGMSAKAFKKGLQILGHSHTIDSFCSEWNDLLSGDNFGMYSNLRLFKDGIKPLWEDPGNKKGGKWVILFPLDFESEDDAIPDQLVRMFLTLLIHLCVGQVGYDSGLCGAGMSVRAFGIMITLWNSNAKDVEEIEYVKERLQELLMTSEVVKYQDHRGTLRKNITKRKEYNLAREKPAQTFNSGGTGPIPARKPGPGDVRNLTGKPAVVGPPPSTNPWGAAAASAPATGPPAAPAVPVVAPPPAVNPWGPIKSYSWADDSFDDELSPKLRSKFSASAEKLHKFPTVSPVKISPQSRSKFPSKGKKDTKSSSFHRTSELLATADEGDRTKSQSKKSESKPANVWSNPATKGLTFAEMAAAGVKQPQQRRPRVVTNVSDSASASSQSQPKKKKKSPSSPPPTSKSTSSSNKGKGKGQITNSSDSISPKTTSKVHTSKKVPPQDQGPVPVFVPVLTLDGEEESSSEELIVSEEPLGALPSGWAIKDAVGVTPKKGTPAPKSQKQTPSPSVTPQPTTTTTTTSTSTATTTTNTTTPTISKNQSPSATAKKNTNTNTNSSEGTKKSLKKSKEQNETKREKKATKDTGANKENVLTKRKGKAKKPAEDVDWSQYDGVVSSFESEKESKKEKKKAAAAAAAAEREEEKQAERANAASSSKASAKAAKKRAKEAEKKKAKKKQDKAKKILAAYEEEPTLVDPATLKMMAIPALLAVALFVFVMLN